MFQSELFAKRIGNGSSYPRLLFSRVECDVEIDGGPRWQIVNFNSKYFVRKLNSHKAVWIRSEALKPQRVWMTKRAYMVVIRLRDVESICGIIFVNLFVFEKRQAKISIFDWDLSRTWYDRADTFVRRIIFRVWVVGWEGNFALDLLRNLSSHA